MIWQFFLNRDICWNIIEVCQKSQKKSNILNGKTASENNFLCWFLTTITFNNYCSQHWIIVWENLGSNVNVQFHFRCPLWSCWIAFSSQSINLTDEKILNILVNFFFPMVITCLWLMMIPIFKVLQGHHFKEFVKNIWTTFLTK